MKLKLEQLRPYLSVYLSDGYRQDELALDAVEVEQGKISANLKVINYFMPGDGRFHFTAPLAFIWVAQLAIIYTCWEHDLSEKPGEIYLREIHLQTRKMINKTENISLILKVTKKRYLVNGTVYYTGSIDIDNGAFWGEGKFVSPLPTSIIQDRL
ncbi:MAG: hypothetical protein KDD94_08025 [Calditrichaeota bacterium]|nr:hypothetical protein [Calditrichota bacterium]